MGLNMGLVRGLHLLFSPLFCLFVCLHPLLHASALGVIAHLLIYEPHVLFNILRNVRILGEALLSVLSAHT